MTALGKGSWAIARDTLRETPALRPLVASTLLGSFTSGLLVPTLPLFLMARGFSFIQLGALFGLVGLSAAIVQLLTGRYQTTFARPTVVLTLSAVPVILFPGYLFADSAVSFFLLGAGSAIAGAAAGPGLSVLIAERTAPETRARVYALMGAASSYAYALALVVGGALLVIGFAAVFYLAGATSLVGFALIGAILLAGRSGEQDLVARALARWRGELRAADARLRALAPPTPAERRAVVFASAHLFVFSLALVIFPVYLPIHLQARGVPLAWIGLVVAASWISFGMAQPWGARYVERTGRWRATIVVSLLAAALLGLAVAWAPVAIAVVAWTLLGIADGIGRPVTQSTLAAAMSSGHRGRMFGATQAASTLARIVAPYSLALVIRAGGLPAGLAVASALFLVSILPLAFLTPAAPASALAPERTHSPEVEPA